MRRFRIWVVTVFVLCFGITDNGGEARFDVMVLQEVLAVAGELGEQTLINPATLRSTLTQALQMGGKLLIKGKSAADGRTPTVNDAMRVFIARIEARIANLSLGDAVLEDVSADPVRRALAGAGAGDKRKRQQQSGPGQRQGPKKDRPASQAARLPGGMGSGAPKW